MPRKKKKAFKRLPNGVGSIKKLSGNRRNCFGVYAPHATLNSVEIKGEPIGYVDTWENGFELLVVWHTMKKIGNRPVNIPDLENQVHTIFRQMVTENPHGYGLDPRTYSGLIETSLRNALPEKEIVIPAEFSWTRPIVKLPTFADIYEKYYEEKYELSGKKYSDSSKNSTRAAFKNCSALHDKVFKEITYDDLQDNLDSYLDKLKYSSLELIVSLYHGMYKFALKRDLVEKNYSSFVEIRKPDDDENGVPFTADDLKKLWHCDSPIAKITIMLCYSGWRITEFKTMDIDRENNLFVGGMKTESGRERIVPIHPSIRPLLDEFEGNPIKNIAKFREDLYALLDELGIEKHTPHDCRHTFSWLCDEARIDKLSKQLMMGHKPDDGVTDRVYGHRDIARLRKEIEQLQTF